MLKFFPKFKTFQPSGDATACPVGTTPQISTPRLSQQRSVNGKRAQSLGIYVVHGCYCSMELGNAEISTKKGINPNLVKAEGCQISPECKMPVFQDHHKNKGFGKTP